MDIIEMHADLLKKYYEATVKAVEETPHSWEACDILHDAVCAFAVSAKRFKAET